MIIRVRPLVTVAFTHGYYGGACRDFEVVTPSSTAAVLRGTRLFARMLNGSLQIAFEADDQGNPTVDVAGNTLTFGLRLTNPFFENVTAPILGDRRLRPFYANGNQPSALDAPLGVVLAVGGSHAHPVQTAARPVDVQLVNRHGAVVAARTLTAGTDTVAQFDLSNLPEGDYRIDEASGGVAATASRVYVDLQMQQAGVWGILAVTLDGGFVAAPAALSIDFAARQEPLKYFVVARNFSPAEFEQLTVTDNGFNEEGRAQVTFEKVPPVAFTDADILPGLLDDTHSRVVLFRSRFPVTRRERGFRKLQLHRNGDVLVEHLPHPGAERSQAQLIIHLSKL